MTSEVEGAVERLTEVMNDAIADHEDDVARAWEDGERPDLWDAPDVTVSIPDLRSVLAALRAQAEEVERLRAAKWDVKHVDTMNDFALLGMDRDAERARAEAAERRAGELEGALRIALSFAKELKNPKACGPRETWERPEWNRRWRQWSYNHGKSLWNALKPYRALLPATQAEGERP